MPDPQSQRGRDDPPPVAPPPPPAGPPPAQAVEPPTQAPEKEPRFRRRKDARPDELIRAALALFAEQGFAAANLKDVAKRAGVSKGTVYLYFKSKEELLLAAVRTAIVPIVDAADELELDASGTAAELLGAVLVRWVQGLDERGVAGVPKLVLAESGNFPELARDYLDGVILRVRRLVARVLQRGVRAGEFRADLDVREATHLVLAPVLYAQVHAAAFADLDPAHPDPLTFTRAHLAAFLRSIAAPTGRSTAPPSAP